jgi:hypothetical protein
MVGLPQWFSCGVYYLTPERARPLIAILEQRRRAILEGRSAGAWQTFIHFFLVGEQLLDTAQALLNSTSQLLARDCRAVAQLVPGDLRMDAAA